MSPSDRAVVAAQLGRDPRGTWRVAARCPSGAPIVIAVAPTLEDGSPFPTTFWLTCPRLTAAVSDAESAGEGTRYADALASDTGLAEAVAAADTAYRAARASEAGGVDPCASVGTAGQRDPLAVKCLHARVAAYLCGIPDPIGEAVARKLSRELSDPCAEPRCHADVAAG